MSDPEREERERRLRALSDLAQSRPAPDAPSPIQTSSDPSPTSVEPRARGVATAQPERVATRLTPMRRSQVNAAIWGRATRRRLHWPAVAVALTAAVIIIIVIGAITRNAAASPTLPSLAASTVGISPRADGVTCAAGAAWSPDGSAMAIVGYQTQCPDSDTGIVNQPGMLVIYDAQNGRALASVTLPTSIIAQKLGSSLLDQLPAGIVGRPEPTIFYQAPVWTPQGERLDLPFLVRPACFCSAGDSYQFAFTGDPIDAGMIELSKDGKVIQVMTATYPAGQRTLEWDTAAGALVAGVNDLAPALAYGWTSDPGQAARLVATTPLSAHPAAGAIGDPTRQPSFTVWQTGWGGPDFIASPASPTAAASNTPRLVKYQQILGVFTWTPSFTAWDPSGRYLVLPNFGMWRVTWPGLRAPTAAALKLAGLTSAPQLVARDPAMSSLFTHLPKVSANSFISPFAMAWSPSGSLLAVAQNVQSDTQPANAPVVVFDTRTGKAVGALVPVASSLPTDDTSVNPLMALQTPSEFGGVLMWSSNNAQVAAFNPGLESITIWTLKH